MTSHSYSVQQEKWVELKIGVLFSSTTWRSFLLLTETFSTEISLLIQIVPIAQAQLFSCPEGEKCYLPETFKWTATVRCKAVWRHCDESVCTP